MIRKGFLDSANLSELVSTYALINVHHAAVVYQLPLRSCAYIELVLSHGIGQY